MIKYFYLPFFLFMLVEASQVKLTPTLSSISVKVNGERIRISRMQDTNHKLRNEYSLTSRISPPFEIQPYSVMEGITTVSELDVFKFIQYTLKKGGVLVDARLSSWFYQSTIPSAVNIPFTTLDKSNAPKVLQKLAVTYKDKKFNFSKAKQIIVFDNGPWCPQASKAIHALVALGYPKAKILYYRGGMQYWSILGLIYAYPTEETDNKGNINVQ
jgi:3-mercaptopyruvate sulfurtransferase SseA